MTKKKARVLWVDDDLDMLRCVNSAFGNCYDLDTMSNFNDASQIDPDKYDLINLDHNLDFPENIDVNSSKQQKTGPDLLKQFRDKGSNTPVVFITSDPDGLRRRKAKLGINEKNMVLDKLEYDAGKWFGVFNDELKAEI
jgi:CheY-like chemotaxis protein